MYTETAIAHITSITPGEVERYRRYLGSIVPTSPEALFQRWLFAFASVHTTWKLNCKLYRMLAPLDWLGSEARLKDVIIASGAGLHNNRTRFISQFSDFYWKHTAWFWKNDHETWTQYRDRISKSALGIGPAKSSFVVEMTYPDRAEVICTDTHVMQIYGKTPNEIGKKGVSAKEEAAMEAHWVGACKAHGVAAPIARWIFWDKKQGHADPRYWSFVFENENYHERFRSRIIG